MVNRLISVDDDLNLPPEVQEALIGPVRTEFETLTVEATSAASSAASSAANASIDADDADAARIAAEIAASQAQAPTDEMVSNLVNTVGSDTRLVLDGKYAALDSSPYVDVRYESLTAAIAATPVGRTLLVTQAYVVASPIVINKAITVTFLSGGSITTTVSSSNALNITSSDVTVNGARLIGTGDSVAGTAKALHVQGAFDNRLTNVHLIGLNISGFSKDGVWLDYLSDFSVINPKISNCGYSGIITISCTRGLIKGGRIRDISKPTGFVNAYGVALTRDSTKSMADSPRSEDITVEGVTVENVPWEGIDTHAGQNLKIIGNTVLGCTVGIAMVGCPDPAGVETWAPINIVCTGNYVDGRTSAGDKSNGIMMVGAGVTIGSPVESATGIISDNVIVDHGSASNTQAVWGGILLYMTKGVVVSNNNIIRPGVVGICLYHTNDGVVLANNTIEDTWTSTAAATAAVFLRSTNNLVSILGTQIVRGNKTATIVNARGLWVNSPTSNSVLTDASNRWAAATLATSGATANLQMSFFGGAPQAKPVSVPVTVAGLHAALTGLNIIS